MLNFCINDSMEQTHILKSDSRSDDQEIPRLLYTMKVHYPVQKNPPLIHILYQINLVHIIITYFFKTNFNIILQYITKSPKAFLPFRFSDSNSVFISRISQTFYMSLLTHSS